MPKRSPISSRKGADATIFTSAAGYLKDKARHRYGGKNAINNLVQDVAMLRSMLNVENKSITTQVTSATCLPTSNVNLFQIGAVIEGTDNAQRTGRSTKLDRADFLLHFTFSGGTTGTVGSQTYRYFVVHALANFSGSLDWSITQLLDSDINGNYSPMSLLNTDVDAQYKMLHEGTVRLVQQIPQSSGNSAVDQIVSFSIPLNMHAEYSGSTVASQESGFLQLFVVAENGVGTAGISTVQITNRVWYVDN
jgi:hypothetical protein